MEHEPFHDAGNSPPTAPDAQYTDPPPPPIVPVVGLGASAGGLRALQQFFAAMPATSGMAFVVILHLSPDHESHAAQILQQRTAMPVTQVTATVPVVPNTVYVIPPTHSLAMQDGHIVVSEPERPNGQLVAIDLFFRTLADTHTTHAVGIVLSGTGADGSVGITRVKETGGIALAQDPHDAEYDAMPRNAITTGLIDWVLPVADMPERLLAWWRNAQRIALPRDADTPVVDATQTMETALADVLALVRARTGHDFTHYKRATILRRIERRMQVTTTQNLPAYRDYLRVHPDEALLLLGDLLIGVTNFFRDRHAFDMMERDVVPQVFANTPPGEAVRVWVAGCATGEEAYSVAMLLMEHAARLPQPPAIQVFATDIDEAALHTARVGSYSTAIETDVAPTRLRQFFTKEPGGYRVTPALRERVLFTIHNLLTDPPFARLDLITCRNLLIYLTQTAQAQVFDVFHFALRPGGFVFLGSAEGVDGAVDVFATVHPQHRVFRTLPASRPTPLLPPVPQRTPVAVPRPRPNVPQERRRIAGSDVHQQLLDAYAPPSVVVNAQGEILYVSERAGRFLHVASGEPTHQLLHVVLPELRAELRTALFHALHTATITEARRVQFTRDDQVVSVTMLVHPRPDPDPTATVALVLFAEVEASLGTDGTPTDGDAPTPAVRHLEAEVERLTEQVHTTIEQYDTTLEELTASNEELQAINEELRSAGEELQTSKEELQSLNEELRTVNDELKHTVNEVRAANADLSNLIASTDIATIFLDRALRIRRYTPRAQDLFNLILGDVGRPLADITHTLHYANLLHDAERVLRTLQPLDREVGSRDDHQYVLHIVPYRTPDERIDGVVLTLVDITARKLADDALRDSEARLRALVTASAYVVYRMSPDWTEMRQLDGQGVLADTAQPSAAWLDTYILPDDQPHVLAVIAEAVRTKHLFELEHRVRRVDGSVGWTLSRAVPLLDAAGVIIEWFGAASDISARKQADDALRDSDARRTFVLEAANIGEWDLDVATGQAQHSWIHDQCFGATEPLADWSYDHFLGYVHPDDRSEVARTFDAAIAAQHAWKFECRIIWPDTSVHWIEAQGYFYGDEHAPAGRMVGMVTDITARMQAEAAVRRSEEKYRTLFTSMDEGFCIVEVLFRDDHAQDYRFLEANPAFEKHTGLIDAPGKTMRALAPQHEEHWFAIYGNIALTGEPARFEQRADALGRWYDVYAFRIGAPHERKVAIFFTDITAQTRRRNRAPRRRTGCVPRRIVRRAATADRPACDSTDGDARHRRTS